MNLSSNLEIIEGFAYYTASLPSSGWQIIREWYDAVAGVVQVSLQVSAAGALQFFQGSGTSTTLGAVLLIT